MDPIKYLEMQAVYLRLLANSYSVPENSKVIQSQNIEETKKISESKVCEPIIEEEENQELKEEMVTYKRPLNDHDEIPIKSIAIPFETLLEQEIKKNQGSEVKQGDSKEKHNFLKRKSQIVKPKSENKDKTDIKQGKSERKERNFSQSLDSEEEKVEETEIHNFSSIKKSPKLQGKPFKKIEISSESIEGPSGNIIKTSESLEKPGENFFSSSKSIENRKSVGLKSLNLDSPSMSSDSPKPKQVFLKRGEGKLCTKVRSASSLKPKKNDFSKKKASDSLVMENSKEYSSESDHITEKPRVLIKPERNHEKNFEKYQKLVKELEEKKKKLEKDALEFYKIRENEVKNLEMWKQEEMKKIAEEKKRIEKSTVDNKATNEEIDKLRKEVVFLKNSIQTNEEKHRKVINDLKYVIEAITQKNKELEKSLTLNSISEISNSSIKPVVIKSSPNKFQKEETPKFKKIEIQKDPPTFTFKLPDSKAIESKSHTKSGQIFKKPAPPVIEINLEENKNVQEIVEEGKTQKVYEDGKKEIIFSNGVKKEIFPDGFVIVYFNNKDKKETYPDGKIVYHFFENKTIQTTFPDGLQLFQFSNGQTEKHYSDGTKEIRFPDGTIKCIFTDGEEESIFPDGTVQKIDNNGVKYIDFVNGMKDTIFPDGSKVRQYPDGKVKKTTKEGKVVEQ